MKITENWGRSDELDEVAWANCLQKVGPLLTTFRSKMTWLDPFFLFIQNRILLKQKRTSEQISEDPGLYELGLGAIKKDGVCMSAIRLSYFDEANYLSEKYEANFLNE